MAGKLAAGRKGKVLAGSKKAEVTGKAAGAAGKPPAGSMRAAAPGKAAAMGGKLPHVSMPVLLVIAFCLVYAVYLGALQPQLPFQKAAGSAGIDAYASGSSLLLRMPHASSMGASALLDGAGGVGAVSFTYPSSGGNVTKIEVNGKVACAPCEPGEKYNASSSGELNVSVFAQEAQVSVGSGAGIARRAFFEKSARTDVDFPVLVSVQGGWRAIGNEAMPSSFYGTDAPFHINRVREAAAALSRLQVPLAQYTYLSVLPAAAFKLVLGISHQFAFKLWEILLFFLPVCVFYLFSRKLSRGADAAFLFASLLYLFLPSQGMLVGGGADLFMYGMVAHTLATSLSLLCLLFAYEFVLEGKRNGFWLAVLFCLLAVAANQRIAASIGIGMFALFCLALPMMRARRAVLLGIACAAASAWLVLPLFAQTGIVGSYSVLGGATPENIGWAVLGFFQLGYYVLPLLFVAGVASVLGRKELFALFLLADCALVFVVATNPEVNALAPFFDGLRFMPSFFLPVFFISGIGALAALDWGISRWRGFGAHFRLDGLDTAVTFAFVVLFPLGVLFASLGWSAMDQYAGQANSVALAAEWGDLKAAYGVIGNGCAVLSGRNAVSFYPVYDEGLGRTVLFEGSVDDAAAEMEKRNCKYLLFGSTKMVADATQMARWQEYAAFKEDARFEEVQYGGAVPLFALKDAQGAEWRAPEAWQPPEWQLPLAAACAAVVLACGYVVGRMGKE